MIGLEREGRGSEWEVQLETWQGTGSQRPSPHLHSRPMSMTAKAQHLQGDTARETSLWDEMFAGPACGQRLMEVDEACLSQRESLVVVAVFH